MKNGFTTYALGKDWFFVTDQTKKTERLAESFLNAIQNHLNNFSNISPDTLKQFEKSMNKGIVEVKHNNNFDFDYATIKTESACICGKLEDEIIILE